MMPKQHTKEKSLKMSNIVKAFQPYHMDRVTMALRSLLNSDTLMITQICTYDKYNVIVGYRKGMMSIPVFIYLKEPFPSIYVGQYKKGLFGTNIISKETSPPFDFDGIIVRFEDCLPDRFKLTNQLEQLLNIKPTNEFEDKHAIRWYPLEISTEDLVKKQDRIKNLWSWTYNVNLNVISGTNVIYLRKHSDLERMKA